MTRPNAQRDIGRIWLLDIDGTLMPSHELDNRCYWRAVHDVVGGAPEALALEGFAEVTDAGILDSWMRRAHGRPPTAREQAAIRTRFLTLLSEARTVEPEAFRPTPGLERWLDRVGDRPGDHVGIATGGWGHTARFKLAAAGLDRYALALASSDDSPSRTGILSIARERALATGGADPSAAASLPTTYVGDGAWDLAAARELGWAFVGIARGERARRLRAAGVRRVLPDFESLAATAEDPFGRSGCTTRAAS